MRLRAFANKYELSLESLQYFVHDFGIDLNFLFTDKHVVSQEFEDFLIKHLDFIRKYTADKIELKSIDQIADTIGVKKEEVADFFLKNGVSETDLPQVRTNISSFQIHMMMGGKYDFIIQDIPQHRFQTNDLIGYADVFFYALDLLDPFINEDQIKLWGISKPAGIILHGPPGSGKIFWAKKLADMIGYNFIHVYNDFLVNTVKVDRKQFSEFLKQQMEKPKTMLYIENFEGLWLREGTAYSIPETMDLVNTILRFIQKEGKNELVIAGGVEQVSKLDDEITAPGRFDLHIPIFPPSHDERAQLIHYHLINDLVPDSPLLAILKANKADHPSFWMPVAAEMRLFSNTMLIDFTQSLKKRLYSIFRRTNKLDFSITTQILQACFNEAKAKLTQEYLQSCYIFIQEAKQNVAMEFPQRIMELEHEFSTYMKKEEPIRKIGFETSAERSQKELNQEKQG